MHAKKFLCKVITYTKLVSPTLASSSWQALVKRMRARGGKNALLDAKQPSPLQVECVQRR